MFLVELIASSFLDLISKRARLDAAVSAFLLFASLGPKFNLSGDDCILLLNLNCHSSIGGTELTFFLRRNLISVRRNTLTR